MSRQLENLAAIGKLKREPKSEHEIAGLIHPQTQPSPPTLP